MLKRAKDKAAARHAALLEQQAAAAKARGVTVGAKVSTQSSPPDQTINWLLLCSACTPMSSASRHVCQAMRKRMTTPMSLIAWYAIWLIANRRRNLSVWTETSF